MVLQKFLKDAHSLEFEIFIYEETEKKYDKFLQKLKLEKDKIYLYESGEQVGNLSKRTNYVMPLPEHKPSYLGERKNNLGRTVSVFGFKGTFDMFRKLPKRWWDEELLNLEKEERARFRRLHTTILLASTLVGILGSLLVHTPIILFVLLIAGVGLCYYVGDENKKEYLPGDPYFEKFMRLYEKKYEKDLIKKHAEFSPKIKLIEEEYNSLILPKLEEKKVLLEQLYSTNVLPSEYQNLVAVTQLYDYLESGRCETLETAIQLYEEELEQDIITTDLELSKYQIEKRNDSMQRMMSVLKYKIRFIDKINDHLINAETSALPNFIDQIIEQNIG